MEKFVDLYEILDLSADADSSKVRSQFRKFAIKYHPDKHNGDEYLTKKFLNAKMAYDILIHQSKRKEYNVKYGEFIRQQSITLYRTKVNRKKREEKEYEEKFFYQPHNPFFSERDRESNDTPRVKPLYDLFGNKLPDDIQFFKYPTKIGKIIRAHSNLTSKSRVNNPSQKKTFKEKLFGISDYDITYVNFFVGINGFAVYECMHTIDNITRSEEFNFSELTDLFTNEQETYQSFIYQWTDFAYIYLNRNLEKTQWEYIGLYNKKQDLSIHFPLALCRAVEIAWNIYLIDSLDRRLKIDGRVTFSVYDRSASKFEDFIYVSAGMIEVKGKGNDFIKYRFNQINKLYIDKEYNLVIEHENFERKMYFLKSGNQSKIPLSDVTNREFLFKAIQILLGFTI